MRTRGNVMAMSSETPDAPVVTSSTSAGATRRAPSPRPSSPGNAVLIMHHKYGNRSGRNGRVRQAGGREAGSRRGVGRERYRGPEPLPRDRLARNSKASRGTGGLGRDAALGGGEGVSLMANPERTSLVVARATHLPVVKPSINQLTWFSCIWPSAARAAREHAPRSARGPRGGAGALREGSRPPCAVLASRAFLVRLARAEISMRHSVHVHSTRAHDPPRPPSP